MTGKFKRSILCFLLSVVFIGFFSFTAEAAVAPQKNSAVILNHGGLSFYTSFAYASGICDTGEVIYISDLDKLKEALQEAMVDREDSLQVCFTGSMEDAISITDDFDGFMEDVFAYDDPDTSSDCDYLDYSYDGIEVTVDPYPEYSIVGFKMTYLTTKSQEDFVNKKVAEILAGLDLDESSQYEKVKAIHDYICDHVKYDDEEEKYSAYEGLYSGETVCQGYSLLAYKMLTDAGVPVKIISGKGFGESHGWNIVKIGPKWYYLDVTWDDSEGSRNYFLKGSHNFSDHKTDAEYLTEEFTAAYPISSENFALDDDVTLIGSIVLDQNSAGLSLGEQLQLAANVNPDDATDGGIQWSSSDPAVASVNNNGLVTTKKCGSVVISVTAQDESGRKANCLVDVYDLATASSWAREDIENLCDLGVVPSGVLTSFTDQITRAEFTALLVQIYEYAKGKYKLKADTPFYDIAGNPNEEEIAKGYELGIINGSGGGSFNPNGTLTREQCAKIIALTVSLIHDETLSSNAALNFTDTASISGWALPYVKNVYAEGLMQGIGSGFSPKGTLTCQEALVIVERMVEQYQWSNGSI